jgi:thiol-disulfide isomerase/thioredoxin
MKKSILFLSFFVLLFGGFNFASAQEKVEVYFFYSSTCPHCAQESAFLNELEDEYPEVEIKRFEVIYSSENQELLKSFYKKYEVPKTLQGLVPATFMPEKYFVGFNEGIAAEIENCLERCMRPEKEGISLINTSVIERNIKIPFLGEIKISSFSFPVMAIALGVLDGFNICSLGALILVLSLALALHSRKKILVFGGIFLVTTAFVYGLLIVFWYKFFEFIAAYLKTMEILIGVLGIGGGIYFLRQFIKLRKRGPACEQEIGSSIASKFSAKLQNILKESSTSSLFVVMGLIFSFAFVITVVEFPCSAVIPVAFAAVLAEAGLSTFQYLFYISIFVLFYLLDEIIVFLVAFFTSKIWLSSPRVFKWIILLEAVILFFLGFYYLFGIL